jgi:hypothetical protein
MDVSLDAAMEFDGCHARVALTPFSSTACWSMLPPSALDETRAICTAGGRPWCDQIERLHRDRASEATLAVSAVAAAACLIALRHRLGRRRGP